MQGSLKIPSFKINASSYILQRLEGSLKEIGKQIKKSMISLISLNLIW